MKFRVFDNRFNKFANSEDFFMDLNGPLFFIEDSLYSQFTLTDVTNIQYNNEPRFILNIFTGFKTRFGEEIFEGDIVKSEILKGEVKLEYGTFIFDNFPLYSYLEDIEIIGNIHENKNLLD